mmetsp:Transcript_6205/g.9780  ORF Transcript_6205/g.9780 Transcript_6205/m.9780 type:complete len:206 (+) Transcript_6205:291-908(+)
MQAANWCGRKEENQTRFNPGSQSNHCLCRTPQIQRYQTPRHLLVVALMTRRRIISLRPNYIPRMLLFVLELYVTEAPTITFCQELGIAMHLQSTQAVTGFFRMKTQVRIAFGLMKKTQRMKKPREVHPCKQYIFQSLELRTTHPFQAAWRNCTGSNVFIFQVELCIFLNLGFTFFVLSGRILGKRQFYFLGEMTRHKLILFCHKL